ncbi:MAG: choice-of-anchor C family protein [Planctomycetes bacterium]|nr:choice-of-anchor C family protein [Planctomycetota bacterium]
MKRLFITTILIVTLVVIAFTPRAEANLILNGSFESGPELLEVPGLWQTVFPPSTAIDNWTVIQSDINYKGAYWEASDGINSLDLNGDNGPGGVEQAFATVIGEEYTVTFDMAGNPSTNPGNDPKIKWLRVAAAGDFEDFSFDVTGKTNAAMGYESHIWSFTAVSTTTTLQFISLDNTQKWGPVLDNVVVMIPEPATLALLSLGSLVLVIRRRRG